MNSNITSLTSDSTFIPVEKVPSRVKKMPTVLWPTLKAMQKVLVTEVGLYEGILLLVKSIFFDAIFNRPKWHPEYFKFKNKEESDHFETVFKQLIPLIIVFQKLSNKYGESFANRVTAEMAIPISVPYQLKIFKPGVRIKKLSEIRQLVSDLLGDGKGHDWTEEVSENFQQVRYRFTKCVFIMILKAYGLKAFAAHVCLADHVVMDNIVPDIVFGRRHAMGCGDDFCDHTITLRPPRPANNKEGMPAAKDEADYEDCYKIPLGRETVRKWERHYIRNGARFKF